MVRTTKLEVSDVWARPVEDLTAKDTSAIYMVITGGSEDDALVKASVPADIAGTVELHETVDMMRHLRSSGARRHVREEIPFYTGRRRPVAELVAALP